MGASHTTLASTSAGGEEGILPELDGTAGNNSSNTSQTSAVKHDLSVYSLDEPLFPGSGRMMRTFRLRNKQNSSKVILKTMYVSKEHESLVTEQQNELRRILEALKGQPHVAPFLYWSLGPYRPKPSINNVPMMARQVSLLRPHMYTTLSDRIASRPFLTHVEKLWIAYQLLHALEAMHSQGVVHGFLTAENIGLTSWNWVVLLDVASYKARTALPDDDPTEYLYYFQENYSHPYAQGTDTTRREKRCYLAPERFVTPNQEQSSAPAEQKKLTAAMDIFSAACVLMETFLNGERALDLGDLMEYRKKQASGTLQQRLSKIEFSAVRAACRHMLHLNPSERLSAKAYIERLEASELIPPAFEGLSRMMEKVTFAPPDARLAIAASYYENVLWDTVGVRDVNGAAYMQNILGIAMPLQRIAGDVIPDNSAVVRKDSSSENGRSGCTEAKNDDSDLFRETEELLRRLENLSFDDGNKRSFAKQLPSTDGPRNPDVTSVRELRSEMSQSSLLIFLQLVVSSVRHVQRPSSKLVALQLMERLGKHSSDEARLQHIVPVVVTLLQDQDPLVRASAIRVLSKTVSAIESFPPSDSKVFPEYIFKRASHLMTDPALVVRLAFADSVAILAETSQRFLDISQAVRLYEAVGGGGGGRRTKGEDTSDTDIPPNRAVFNEEVANLLDGTSDGKPSEKKRPDSKESTGVDSLGSDAGAAGKSLINSTYSTELAGLHETVSRWVVHITTDRSEHSSPVKRALLSDMARLCAFFGLDGVMAFILPQLLSFLNDRKDWLLREALFECLPSVCNIIGRAATEHFVLPCLETALVDGVESVVSRALQCLTHLVTMGLVTRSALLGTYSGDSSDAKPGYVAKPLLRQPAPKANTCTAIAAC
jgi:phosphoinositide-3-kinase, regulatory subunit 4